MKERSQSRRYAFQATAVNTASAALAALFFLYVEIATASFQAHWLGGTFEQWRDAFTAFLLMGVVLSVPVAIVFSVFLLLRRGRRTIIMPEATAVALFVTGCALGLLESPMLLFGLLIGSAALLVIARLIARLGYPFPYASLALAMPILSAIATLPLAHRFLFLEQERAQLCLALSLTAFAVGLILTLLLLVLVRNARRKLVVAFSTILLVCGVVPGLLYGVPEIEARLYERDPGTKSMLFATADALRADWCSVYGGYIPTPAMESMAARGVLFERCYSLAPYTTPSLSGLFASKYPPSLSPGASLEQHSRQIVSMPARVSYWCDEKGLTFPQRASGGIQPNGEGAVKRHTALFLANPALFHSQWLTSGFKHLLHLDSVTPIRRGRFQLTPQIQQFLAAKCTALCLNRTIDSTRYLTEYTKLFVRRYRNRPFFLWVHFMDPHNPYDNLPDNVLELQGLDIQRIVKLGTAIHGANNQTLIRSCYQAEVQYLDDGLGQILHELERLGLHDTTYLCFSADHGEAFAEHGQPVLGTHAFSMYDEELRVPLLLIGPDIKSQRVVDPVSHIDLVPTFAALLDVAFATAWQGHGLHRTLRGSADPGERFVFAQCNHTFFLSDDGRREPLQTAVQKNLKLIRGLESGAIELYDLSEDPGEHHRLEEERPAEAARLLDLLEEWSASFPYCFERLEAAGNTSQIAPQTDDDFRKTLEAMGYL